MKALLLPLALLAAAGSAPPQPDEARIPFIGFRTIRTFHPVDDDTLYLQDTRRNWYRATLAGPCFNLMHALRIGVDTRYTGDTLDNTSSFLVDGQRCPIHSLVRSDPPPSRRRR